jgi:hypothetical protein
MGLEGKKGGLLIVSQGMAIKDNQNKKEGV